jgi:hypothetical protein
MGKGGRVMSDKSITLDPRIIGGLQAVLMPNDVLTDERAARFSLPPLRTVGYAADHLITFQDLGTDPNRHLFRIVEVKCGSPFPFRCRVVGNSAAVGDFSFFLPADQVAACSDNQEEKQYRPFKDTREFFIKTNFEEGDLIHIRSKNKIEYWLMLVGWTNNRIKLGTDDFTFENLFENFELWDGEENFIPFGVEAEL